MRENVTSNLLEGGIDGQGSVEVMKAVTPHLHVFTSLMNRIVRWYAPTLVTLTHSLKMVEEYRVTETPLKRPLKVYRVSFELPFEFETISATNRSEEPLVGLKRSRLVTRSRYDRDDTSF